MYVDYENFSILKDGISEHDPYPLRQLMFLIIWQSQDKVKYLAVRLKKTRNNIYYYLRK